MSIHCLQFYKGNARHDAPTATFLEKIQGEMALLD